MNQATTIYKSVLSKTVSALLAVLMTVWIGGTTRAEDLARSGLARKTIVVLGDSLAAGAGVEPAQAFPALLQKKIDAAGLNFIIVNAGVSGDTSADGLARIDWLLKRKIDVFVLE